MRILLVISDNINFNDGLNGIKDKEDYLIKNIKMG